MKKYTLLSLGLWNASCEIEVELDEKVIIISMMNSSFGDFNSRLTASVNIEQLKGLIDNLQKVVEEYESNGDN